MNTLTAGAKNILTLFKMFFLLELWGIVIPGILFVYIAASGTLKVDKGTW
jgi:hypothetical protein